MSEREIHVDTPDGPMQTFVVHPEGGPFPVAILFPDGVGYREQLKKNARRFAADGFYVAVPELYHRSGENVSFDIPAIAAAGFQGPEFDRMRACAMSVTPALAETDIRALLAAIADDPAALPGDKVCVGYCMGARVSLHAASAFPDEFVAAAGIHPGTLVTDAPDSPHLDLDTVRGELYFAFGDYDESAPQEMIDRLRTEMAERGVAGEVDLITGARHGFSMADLPVYDEQAAEDHFGRTLDLWRRNLAAATSPQ